MSHSSSRGKRIVICCDGTWQSAVSGLKNSPSNVTRVARCLDRVATDKDGKTWDQIVWYDSGVGTTSSNIGKMHEGAIGAGLEGNIIEAYNFVALNYTPGDQLFCFGFSRGAYTARSIAGLISDIGICEPRQLHYFPDIWELYKKTKAGERFYGSDAWWEWLDGKPADIQPKDLGYKNRNFIWDKIPHGDWAVTAESREIEVVGVYDTVGALGLPSVLGYDVWIPFGPDKPGFHNVKLNRNIKRAYHALALDEHREAFAPTLWHLPETEQDLERRLSKQQKIVEEAKNAWYAKSNDQDISPAKKKELKNAWNKARQTLLQLEESQKPASELLQVWFPGVHINVGGGSSDTLKNEGDLEEMSNITFAWMMDQIRPYLSINTTTFNQESRARQNCIDALNREARKYEELVAANKAAAATQSWKATVGSFFTSAASAAGSMIPFVASKPDPARHDYGWGTGTIIDSYTTMYKANGSQSRTPGAYAKDKKQPTPGQTNEMIHPTVGYRIEITKQSKDPKNAESSNSKVPEYHPLGLNHVQRKGKKDFDGKGPGYIIGEPKATTDKVPLPEYVMKPREECFEQISFERIAIEGEKAYDYVKKLDMENGFKTDYA